MRKLARKHVRVLKAGIAERNIAGARFARRLFCRVLARIEVARCLARYCERAPGDAACKERYRCNEITGQDPDIVVDVGHAGEGREAETGCAARCRHIARALEHQDHVQDDEQRPPGCQIEEARDVSSECDRSGLGHQEQREEHRKERVEYDRQDDIEDRDPLHRVMRDRGIGPFGLDIGAGLREHIDARCAACSGEAMHRLVHGVDGQNLAEDAACILRDSCEVLIGNRQVGNELGRRERFGLPGVELAPGDLRHLIDKPGPLAGERSVCFAAGDDRGRDAIIRLPGYEALCTRGTAGRNRRPDIVAL